MSTVARMHRSDEPYQRTMPPIEENRGVYAMWATIATEFSLFVCLFASYFYLGTNKQRWEGHLPPKLHWALAMLAVMVVSSVVLGFGQKQVARARYGSARLALVATAMLAVVFLVLQAFEFRLDWQSMTPYSDSYGSIFYAITGFSAAHAIMGLLILAYACVLPRYGPSRISPYRPYQVAAMFWQFVVFIWVVTVLILYLIPNWMVYGA